MSHHQTKKQTAHNSDDSLPKLALEGSYSVYLRRTIQTLHGKHTHDLRGAAVVTITMQNMNTESDKMLKLPERRQYASREQVSNGLTKC